MMAPVDRVVMKATRASVLALSAVLFSFGCGRSKAPAPSRSAAPAEPSFIVGVCLAADSPTTRDVLAGLRQAIAESGLRDGVDIRLDVRSASGELGEVHRIVDRLVADGVDVLVPVSTPCLQAALISARSIPIVFTSVANPYLLGAGRTAEDHLPRVTGIASTAPIRQSLGFIREALPRARRVGTLWTPSEVNSEYYLGLARDVAAEMGFELVEAPVSDAARIVPAAQTLVNRRIDAFFQISDNTINASFASLGRVAEDNVVPLFGGFLQAAQLGACAALGYDFRDMGYKAGGLVLRVKGGEDPGRIPFQAMDRVRTWINLDAAKREGVSFPAAILDRADKILDIPPLYRSASESPRSD